MGTNENTEIKCFRCFGETVGVEASLYAHPSMPSAILCRFCRLRQNIDYAVRSRTKLHKNKKRQKTESSLPFFGGDKRDRTADLLNAIQALSRYRQKHTPFSPLQAKKTLRSQNGTAIIHTDIFCIISKCIKAKNFLLLKACKISVFSHRL